ncbi:hypothetical protein [Alsobacter sp. R-9]
MPLVWPARTQVLVIPRYRLVLVGVAASAGMSLAIVLALSLP